LISETASASLLPVRTKKRVEVNITLSGFVITRCGSLTSLNIQ
jgi:hypothetical protein